jgi:RNA polymerase sigma-70 factor (ECF subfamily)
MDYPGELLPSPTMSPCVAPEPAPGARIDEQRVRLEALFALEFDFVEKTLGKYGVPPADIDDAVQQVFIVLGRKLVVVRPGSERGFLYRTAVHVAAHARRGLARKRELFGELPEMAVDEAGADELIDSRRARDRIERALAKLPSKLQVILTLHDIEQKTMLEIATALGVPSGTVASRLRRGRARLERELLCLRVESPLKSGSARTFSDGTAPGAPLHERPRSLRGARPRARSSSITTPLHDATASTNPGALLVSPPSRVRGSRHDAPR